MAMVMPRAFSSGACKGQMVQVMTWAHAGDCTASSSRRHGHQSTVESHTLSIMSKAMAFERPDSASTCRTLNIRLLAFTQVVNSWAQSRAACLPW